MKFVPTPMSARPSYAEAWQIAKAIRLCGAGFVGAIAWTSTRSMEANYSTRGPKGWTTIPCQKALIDAMDDIYNFKPFLKPLHTLQFVKRCANNKQRKFACQRPDISLEYRHNLFEGGSYQRRGEADHKQRVPTLSLILLPSYF